VAESLGDAILHLRTDDSGLDKGLGDAKAKTEKLAADLSATGQRMRGIGANLSLALTVPLAAFAGQAMSAAVESRQALAQVEATVKSMGPVAGYTSAQLQEMAGKLENISNFDDDDILKSVTANMLTFGNIGGEAFERAQLAAVNLSARLGQDLQSSTMQLGKALNDPVQGITALSRVGVSFTAQQKEQVKAMVAAGNAAGAQSLILAELEKQFGGAAEAQRKATPTAESQQQWRKLQETVGEIALKALPPLTNLLTSVLTGFNSLSPGMQETIVQGAGIVAALGPVIYIFGALTSGLGGIVSGVGSVLPWLAKLAPSLGTVVGITRTIIALIGTLGRVLLGLVVSNPILAALAAAVGAVYLAWQNWDKIKPIIDAVGAAISAWWTGSVQPVLKAAGDAVKALVTIFTEYFGNQIQNVVKLVSALFQGDFRGAWEALKGIVKGAIDAAIKAVGVFAPNIAKALSNVVSGMIQTGKDIVAGLAKGILAAPEAVWNALVSVVDEGWKKAKKFLDIRSPSGLFAVMGGQITDGLAQGILNGISTVDAALAQLGDAVEKGGLDLSGLATPNLDFSAITVGTGGTGGAVDGGTTDPQDETGEKWREGFSQWFGDGIEAALNGDLKGFLKDSFSRVFDGAFRSVLGDLGNSLAQLFGGSGGGGGLGGLISGIFGGFGGGAGGGGGFGGGGGLADLFSGFFAQGGTIPSGQFGIVGERGPEAVFSTARGALIRPNSALSSLPQTRSGGTNVSISIPIDATGADPAALSRVQSSLDRMRAELPGMIVETVNDASERRILSGRG
jgi:phage-related protein